MRACRARHLTKHQIRESPSALNLAHWSKNQRGLSSHSRCRSFEFFTGDRLEADAVAGPQKHRRIFFRIEQLQRRAADYVPATGRFDWIDSGLRSADRDRTSRNFFARNISPRCRNFARQTAKKWETGREPDAMNAIIGSAVKIDNFFPMHARMLCDFIEVERELLFVANWNFYKRCFGPIGMNFSCIGQRLANPLFDPPENILDVFFDFVNTRMNFLDQIMFGLRELLDPLGHFVQLF